MCKKSLGVIAGLAVLASVGVASAGQPVGLTDAQLDKVAAGSAQVGAQADNIFAFGTFSLTSTPTIALAIINADFFNPTPSGTPTLILQAVAVLP